jgi:predicted metal-dependent HD superfamily phosphohydrolase
MPAGESAKLQAYWDVAWADLALPGPAAALDALIERYCEPHRAYHTLRHLEECFELFADARDRCAHPGEVAIALWFHDAVYDPKSTDNEAQSARWAERILRDVGAAPEVQGRVASLILVTKHDAQPRSDDARVLVDIDLAILGAEPARFDEYETQVRAEYAHVPKLLFRKGRAKILKQFLARSAIYSTDAFRNRFEVRARANLKRSLARL